MVAVSVAVGGPAGLLGLQLLPTFQSPVPPIQSISSHGFAPSGEERRGFGTNLVKVRNASRRRAAGRARMTAEGERKSRLTAVGPPLGRKQRSRVEGRQRNACASPTVGWPLAPSVFLFQLSSVLRL